MTTTMTCDQLDAALADYLEGDLDLRMRARVEKHLGECLRCASLARDVQQIRRDAANLPVLEPSRDLWDDIATRIEAPVIPLTARELPVARVLRPAWLGVAAAALVAITAGVTYTLTVERTVGIASVDSSATRPADTSGGALPSPSALSAQRSAPPVAGVETAAADLTYNREITRLKTVLDQRRADLDPSTVAVVENSLVTIDRAINDARGALARDPASTFLNDQLNKALEKKLGLLRTVALLPPRA